MLSCSQNLQKLQSSGTIEWAIVVIDHYHGTADRVFTNQVCVFSEHFDPVNSMYVRIIVSFNFESRSTVRYNTLERVELVFKTALHYFGMV